MAITIPDRTQIRITTDFSEPQNGQALPATAARVALTNPGPVMVSSTSPNSRGQILVEQAAGDAGREGYLGYNIKANVPVNGVPSVVRGTIVDGFAGVTPGGAVFVDATSADASGTASGLTHAVPATGDQVARIGVGVTATKIRFD